LIFKNTAAFKKCGGVLLILQKNAKKNTIAVVRGVVVYLGQQNFGGYCWDCGQLSRQGFVGCGTTSHRLLLFFSSATAP